MAKALANRRPAHGLGRDFYVDPAFHHLDLELIWHREWVVVGHAAEISSAGDFLTARIGLFNVIVVRGADGTIRALHNVCRHRGFQLCDAPSGSTRRRFVCPYHQWSYELDGTLATAREMGDDFDRSNYALAAAHCREVEGMIFVSVADEPVDFEPIRATVGPYLAPFDLSRAKVAHVSTVVESGNWKLVMENNRECFHCRVSHPELCVVFPLSPLHSGGGNAIERAGLNSLVAECEAAGLPSRFTMSADMQYRVMRMQLLSGATSMTIDGRAAVAKRLAEFPLADIGDVLLYHYPSTWNHFVADHAVVFRILPIDATHTELRTVWLVAGDAVEGVDYDVTTLTEVWTATNAQDQGLVERVQRGVASPAYRPGPYSTIEEDGVIQFIDWYAATMQSRLRLPPDCEARSLANGRDQS